MAKAIVKIMTPTFSFHLIFAAPSMIPADSSFVSTSLAFEVSLGAADTAKCGIDDDDDDRTDLYRSWHFPNRAIRDFFSISTWNY